jgi:hypothetical protein
MNPLVQRIIAVRSMIAGLETARRPDRDLIMRQSIFLGGLEEAAELVLGPDDLSAPWDHHRTGKVPS